MQEDSQCQLQVPDQPGPQSKRLSQQQPRRQMQSHLALIFLGSRQKPPWRSPCFALRRKDGSCFDKHTEAQQADGLAHTVRQAAPTPSPFCPAGHSSSVQSKCMHRFLCFRKKELSFLKTLQDLE